MLVCGLLFILSKLSLCCTNTVISPTTIHVTPTQPAINKHIWLSFNWRSDEILWLPSFICVFDVRKSLEKSNLKAVENFQVLCWNEAENWLSVSGCDKNIWWDLHRNSLTEWICVKYSSPNLRFTNLPSPYSQTRTKQILHRRSFLERLKWYDASDEWMLIYSNEQQHRKFTFSCLPETPTLTAFTRKYLGHRKIFHFWEFLLDYDEEPFSLHTLVNPISWQNWINQ